METRYYELMFVVSPELEGQDLESLLQRVQRYLENVQAEVLSFKEWGLRRLAYPIKKQREGRYYLVRFAAPPQQVNDFDRSLRLVEGVLRHLIVRLEEVENVEDEEEAAVSSGEALAEEGNASEAVEEAAPLEEVVEETSPSGE